MSFTHIRSAARAAAVSMATVLALQACSGGSGPGQAGSRGDVAPTARAQVLNGGATNVFRQGSEVMLTGKDSEDGDGPVLAWSWRQTSGPAVRLIERNTTTVSFTAPQVAAASTLAFELTVQDSQGLTGSAPIEVTVVPALDPDRFLSLDLRGARRNTFDQFKVVAALAEGASTSSTKPFTLSARAYLVYPPRSAQHADCSIDAIDFGAGVPGNTPGGCAVELLEDLTPDPLPNGGTGAAGQWPANVPAVVRPDGVTPERIAAEWWNTHFTLPVPRLDVAEFNQRFVESGARHRMLDLFNASRTRILLAFELAAPENQGDATIIINDVESAPVSWPAPSQSPGPSKVVTNTGGGLPTTLIMPLEQILGAIPARESALTAEVYYRTVDPIGTRRTLHAWLQQAGFAPGGDGVLLPEAVAGTGEFAHGIYLNNYDLGFGRDMYTRVDDLGNVYAFVDNYATLEGAIRGVSRIVTVAMEYSARFGPFDPSEKFVKFFTYVDDGSGDAPLATSMDFDGRGERFTPGNCVACHGGAKPPGLAELDFDPFCGDPLNSICYAWPVTNADGVDIANGNLHATFLPWDLDSLLFADTDPAIVDAPLRFDGLTLRQRLARDHGDFSRAAQEAQFKKLNEAAYATYCNAAEQPGCVSDAARRLVEHWYGGADQHGNLLGSFDDSVPPPGWGSGEVVAHATDPNATVVNPSDAATIYHEVYSLHCRMCHTNVLEPALRFDTYQKLAAFAPLSLAFREGTMPAARLTMDRFWVPQHAGPAPARVLAEHFGLSGGGPSPEAAIQSLPATVPRHDPVRATGHDSLFAESFRWEVDYTPPPELAGSVAVLGYQPAVVGERTPEIAFVPERPGSYAVNLLINDGDSESPGESSATRSVTVVNRVPLACDDHAATTPGGASVQVAFLQNDRFAAAGSGANCSSSGLPSIANGRDLPITYVLSGAFDQNGEYLTANGGTFVLDPGEPCAFDTPAGCADDTLTYTPNNAGDSYVETLTYTITDADGESTDVDGTPLGTGVITVAVSEALLVSAQNVSDPLSEAPADLTLAISGGAAGNPGERYTVTLTTAPNRGTVSRNGQPMSLGSAFQTDAVGGTLHFVYESDLFETGLETVVFTVTDSAATTGEAEFEFTVRPRAPFATPSENGELGTVMNMWTSTQGSQMNCEGCHGVDASATAVFDPTESNAGVYAQLVEGTKGRKLVVESPDRQTNADASWILCYPSLNELGVELNGAPACPSSHNAGTFALPPESLGYQVILRWIQEGAREN